MFKNILIYLNRGDLFPYICLFNIVIFFVVWSDNQIIKKKVKSWKNYKVAAELHKKQWGTSMIHINTSKQESEYKLYTLDKNGEKNKDVGYLRLISPIDDLYIKLADDHITIEVIK